MTDTEDDKYHKVLELVESLNFKDGAYVKICDSLKSIKSLDLTNDVVIRVEMMNVKFDFKISDKLSYTYVFHEKHIFRNGPDKLKYSVVVRKKNNLDQEQTTFKDYMEPYYDHHNLLFRQLTHSKDIIITYYDEDGNMDFTLEFKNLPDLERYYHKQEKEDCKYCCSGSEEEQGDEPPCETDHEELCYRYLYSLMLCHIR